MIFCMGKYVPFRKKFWAHQSTSRFTIKSRFGHYDFWSQSQSHQLDGYFSTFILGRSALRKWRAKSVIGAEGAEPSAGARNCKPARSAGLDS